MRAWSGEDCPRAMGEELGKLRTVSNSMSRTCLESMTWLFHRGNKSLGRYVGAMTGRAEWHLVKANQSDREKSPAVALGEKSRPRCVFSICQVYRERQGAE